MLRTQLYADPAGRYLHDLILESCRRFPERTAIVDTSAENCRLTYAQYGERVWRLAGGLVAGGLRRGDRLGIYLPNSWEFCAAYHAATLAGAIPTPLNPSYREREVRYQLENSGAAMLISDGPLISGMNLADLPELHRVFYTRERGSSGAEPFKDLFDSAVTSLPNSPGTPETTLAALPYSSGTTGLPKGVMLSHSNLVVNVFQVLAAAPFHEQETALCFLPLYHIYGLNVVLNPILTIGGTLLLMPRFDLAAAMRLISAENISFMPVVPPVLNAFTTAAEQGLFPRERQLRWVKCGAAPLAPELPRRFTALTGIQVVQGYGMTEASPVTHVGISDGPLSRPESIGVPVALTECMLLKDDGSEAGPGETGELVMRGPQFMLGYWNAPEATVDVLRPLPPRVQPKDDAGTCWYYSGDMARVDADGLYTIVDRRKEMIKYKGFAVAPAEVESVLLEHPGVRDCGVIGRTDAAAGEVPVAFVVLRDGLQVSHPSEEDLCAWVGERLTSYKQPREIRFLAAIPRNPSGKILRRELRKLIEPNKPEA